MVGQYEISFLIYDHQGVNGLNPQAGTLSSVTVGSHEARQLDQTTSCTVAMAITKNSSVESMAIGVTSGGGCQLAQQYAAVIEHRLVSTNAFGRPHRPPHEADAELSRDDKDDRDSTFPGSAVVRRARVRGGGMF